jgi:hypothetical protein
MQAIFCPWHHFPENIDDKNKSISFKAQKDSTDGALPGIDRSNCLIHKQGDQIGQIFAYWGVDYFGLLFEYFRCSSNSWATHFQDTYYVLIWAKNGLSFILGNIFSNSSGHPVHKKI